MSASVPTPTPGDSGDVDPGVNPLWQALIGWCIDNRLIVLVLTAMLVVGGVYVAPFQWGPIAGITRDPVPVDAIPDIGENQQIVFTEWQGRSPRDVEDQITYPLTTALMGIPGVRTVRSSSALGFSSIYVIFNDDIEFYWSRSRLLEKLSALPAGTLPDDVTPTLGPDATALGQVFWYTLEGHDKDGRVVGGFDQDELRSIQDWTVRYALQSVEGVSEVGSIGGFVREYQVDVDPEAMRAHGVSLAQVANAVRGSNLDVGARTLEVNGVEYVVRGLGFIKDVKDLEAAVVVARDNTPIRVRDVGRVSMGPALRRGALDDEGAPAVGGVVVARTMENPLQVISAVKEKITQIRGGLPKRTLADGTVSHVTIVPFYDRTVLIGETLSTLSTSLFQEILITIIVVLVMLRNLRTSMLISMMLPLGVLGTFIVMKLTGVDANIMALAGIAIAIGTMVDISIVFVENINQHFDDAATNDPEGVRDDDASSARNRAAIVRRAAAEVAPAVMTSVLTTVVSFLPVLALTSTELRLFGPLAMTKSFAMTATFILAVIVLPGASLLVLRRRPRSLVSGGSGLGALWRSIWRREHVLDWLMVAAGAVAISFNVVGGLLVCALGISRLARPMMSPSSQARLTVVENVVAVIAVAIVLAMDWLPLGRGQGVVANVVAVAVAIGVVMGSFRIFEAAYPRLLGLVLQHKVRFLIVPTLMVAFGFTAWLGFDRVFAFLPESIRTLRPVVAVAHGLPGFGREYMPDFDEGSFLYMPTTMPHASIGEALQMLSEMDAAIAAIPEVDRVVGKLGRVESALDPAPVSMIETIITYKPEYAVDDNGDRLRQWRDHIQSPRDIWNEISAAAARPGLTGAPTLMPINARIVMLQSGMRAPMGIKVHGPTLETIEAFGIALGSVLETVPGVRKETVFADRVVGKPYIEIDVNREAIGRFGLSVVNVQNVLQVALGGMTLTRSVEGRARYPVRVRYMREERDSIEALERISVPTPGGEQILLLQLADIRFVRGPQMIKSEDTFLTSYVLFDRQPDRAEVDIVEEARAVIDARIDSGDIVVPDGVSFAFAGSYENQVRSEKRLALLVPLALCLVFILLYLQFHRVAVSAVIASGVAVAAAGGFTLMWLYGQPWFLNFSIGSTSMRDLFHVGTVNLSVAVWIGFIALVGIATDDGVVISTYLKQRFEAAPPTSRDDVRARTLEAGIRRVRPCLMTTATTILALLPVVTSQGRGADIMMPMALPSLGGMLIEVMTLFVVPVLFCAIEERCFQAQQATSPW